MERRIKNIAFILVVVILTLPAFQHFTGFFRVRSLDGDYILAPKPAFTWKGWFSGDFQKKFNSYLEDSIGFRSFLVRLNNQIDFTLFHKANAEGVVVGKDRMLYEFDYIRAYTGKDFIGKNTIRKKLNRVKFLQQYLKKHFNIDFIIIFEPGKARFYPEYIPDHYLDEGKTLSNYEYFIGEAENLGIRFIDFNKYYLSLKGTKPYPLYTKWGIHWSEYGMSFAADSLIKYIEKLRGIDLPEMIQDSLVITNHLDDSDYDVGKTMNLLWRLPHDEVAYPRYRFSTDDKKTKPMVLTIADSYYWNIFNTRLPRNLFANEAFWYFNAKVYPDFYHGEKWVKSLDLRQEIEKQDIIILSVTDRFMYKFGWGFVDDAFKLYSPDFTGDVIYEYANGIRQDAAWFDSVLNKTRIIGKTLEEAINDEAAYQAVQEKPDVYITWYGPEYYKNVILSSAEWTETIKKKAADQGVSFDEMLSKDADYEFQNSQPALFEKYYLIRKFIHEISTTPDWYESIKQKAAAYYMDTATMLNIDAEYMANMEISKWAGKDDLILKYEDLIRQDQAWLEAVRKKAVTKGLPLEVMIREDAKYMVEQEHH